MLLLGSQEDRSVVDRIGSALQQRAQVSPTQMFSSSSPSSCSDSPLPSPGQKRPAPMADSAIQCKKPCYLPELCKPGEEEHSDSEVSDQGTNDYANSECVSPQVGPSSMSDVFCSVPGRLSLLSSTSKYKVTIGEIQRRLSHPECLNASILGGILRRAKSKNGGKELRDTLERMGLSLPAGRRKSATVTLLTSMVEGEALHLARDFTLVCENEFPANDIAKAVLKRSNVASDLKKRKDALVASNEILSELSDILSKDCSPVVSNHPETILEQSLQDPLTHFSLCTHGFGTPTLLASLNAVLKYVKTSLEMLEAKPSTNAPITAPPSEQISPAQNLLLSLHPSVSFAALMQSEMLKMVEASQMLSRQC